MSLSQQFDSDVMIDLETTGVSAGCCILTIGACTLDLSQSFYTRISHSSCLESGLKDNPSTVAWWGRQSEEARLEAFGDGSIDETRLALPYALDAFNNWLRGIKPAQVWGNGADFDLPILGAAYEAVNSKPAYGAFSGRCYRTMKTIYPWITQAPFQGVKHNALADAEHQARHLHAILSIHYSTRAKKEGE